jgi:DNA-binding CsgD family transcriptional regulator
MASLPIKNLLERLTEDEFKVYNLIKVGYTSKKIAEFLNFKVYAVKILQMSIYKKLGVTGRLELVHGKLEKKINRPYTRKKYKNLKCTAYALRYRFLKDCGFNSIVASTNHSKKKFEKLLDEHNIKYVESETGYKKIDE